MTTWKRITRPTLTDFLSGINVRSDAEAAEDTGTCRKCGAEYITDPSGFDGVLVHADEDSPTGIDHDTDEDHAPVPEY